MANLLLQHRVHQVWHRPHPFANLGIPGQTTGQTGIDVPVFIGADPRRAFHVGFADHRAGIHRGVDFIARAVQEAGIDKRDPVTGRADTFLQIDSRATLLIHDADLHRVQRQPQCLLDHREGFIGKCNFFRAMHLGLDDINRPGG